MTVSLASIMKLASLGLSTEQMAAVMEVLAVELAPLEAFERDRQARLAKDRDRKFHGKSMERSTEIPRKADGNSAENPRNASRVESNYINTNLDQPSRKTPTPPSPPSSKPDPDGFAEFWAIYPKRGGGEDRKSAVKAFAPALKRASLKTILDGAQHYADAMEARGKARTEFVAQARTWLNGERWNERYDDFQTGNDPQAEFLAILERHAAPPRQ